MKIFYCFLFILGISYSYGQSSNKIALPVLKEDLKIDSLMDKIFTESIHNDKGHLNDNYWIIELRTIQNYVSFQIFENDPVITNYFINQMGAYSYFQYKGYNMFVWTEDNFHGFFTKTSEVKTFNSIYKLNTDTPKPSEKLLHEHVSFHYKYENGRFSIEGPPGVLELK